MNKPVSFELAKLLKEKRFGDYSYQRVFTDSENPIEDIVFGSFEVCEANYKENKYLCKLDTIIEYPTKTKEVIEYYHPTIAEVVMWLYEKHGIWVNVWKYYNEGFYFSTDGITNTDIQKLHNSPTEAYEAAIEYCLTKVI